MRNIRAICLAVSAFSAVVAAPESHADTSQKDNRKTSACASLGGYIEGPVVPDVRTARQLFILLRNAVDPSYRSIKPDIVTVDDKGAYWEASQRVKVSTGSKKGADVMGGGIWMDIDKCNGAVLKAGRSR